MSLTLESILTEMAYSCINTRSSLNNLPSLRLKCSPFSTVILLPGTQDMRRLCIEQRGTSIGRECNIYQRNKSENISHVGLLQPLPIPTWVWTNITMDFVEGLPLSKGHSMIFVVVDWLSKYNHFMSCTSLKYSYDGPAIHH
jgi:hypothetical protein